MFNFNIRLFNILPRISGNTYLDICYPSVVMQDGTTKSLGYSCIQSDTNYFGSITTTINNNIIQWTTLSGSTPNPGGTPRAIFNLEGVKYYYYCFG